MNFDELINFLEKRLQEDMPGEDAHNIMKPKMPNGAPVQMKHATPPREGGVLILLYEEDGIVRFPLIQRPQYEGVHSGQIALPGGKKESTDKDLIDTSLREANEEIGVDQSEIEVIGTLSKFFVSASNYNVLPVVGKIEEKPDFIPEPREVDELISASISDLVDSRMVKEKELIVRNGFKLLCPYFDLESKVVWGATAMMLSEFVEILRKPLNS